MVWPLLLEQVNRLTVTVTILLLNAVAILNEERFLARSMYQHTIKIFFANKA